MTSNLPFLISSAIFAVMSIPLMANLVPPNRFYGFRTRLTLSSERIWYRANHFAGWALFIAAIVSAVVLWVVPLEAASLPGYGSGVVVVPLLIAVAASYLYSRSIDSE